MAPSFFETESPLDRGGFDAVFVRELQLQVTRWDSDVTPELTSVDASADPILVKMTIPGLSGPVSTLWVTCRHTTISPPILRGAWGRTDYLGDAHGLDPIRDLTISGIPSGPQELADLTARWFHTHAFADIYRDEFDTGPWLRRDLHGPTGLDPDPNRTRTHSVLERTGGHATGQHLG